MSGSFRRLLTITLTLGLAAAGPAVLTGCTTDQRPEAIEAAVLEAVDAEPYIDGATLGDVARAVSQAGKKAATILIPVQVPDLGAVLESGAAPEFSATEPAMPTARDASAILAPYGERAWRSWLAENATEVTRRTVMVPVSATQARGEPVEVSIDQTAMRNVLAPFQQTNLRLYVEAVAGMQPWQGAVVADHWREFIPELTGLPAELNDRVRSEGPSPTGDGAWRITLTYPDPAGVIAYRVEAARQSYGDSKLFGGVSRGEIKTKAERVEDFPESFGGPPLTTSAEFEPMPPPSPTYSLSDSVEENLISLAQSYRVELRSSPPAPTYDDAWEAAIDQAIEELAPNIVMPAERPGTSRLIGGGTGQPMKITAQGVDDLHVTFFSWGTSEAVVSVFVKSGESLSLRLPRGDYHLVYASGETWYGPEYSFGPDGYYSEYQEDDAREAKKYSISGGYSYELTFQVDSGANMTSGSAEDPYPH